MNFKSLKKSARRIIFGYDTFWGKTFDLILLAIIVISIINIFLETVSEIAKEWGHILFILEIIFSLVFTIEYLFRIWISKDKVKFVLSFWGIIDFLSFFPFYLNLFIPGKVYLMTFRVVRIIRLFRILNMNKYFYQEIMLKKALRRSSPKILVFLFILLVLVTILGTFMFTVENGENGFTSIPNSIYWAIETVTTVGYGDVTPVTVMGKMIASVFMLISYSILTVPTGIVALEISKINKNKKDQLSCNHCGEVFETKDVKYCYQCGRKV